MLLPLRARVNMETMAMKRYSTVTKALALFSVISRTLVEEVRTPLQMCSRCILQPQLNGPPFKVLIRDVLLFHTHTHSLSLSLSFTHTHTRTYVYIYIYVDQLHYCFNIDIFIMFSLFGFTHTYTHTHLYTHTHTRTHIYIYIYI